MERKFKGIWIPSEMWLDKSLSIQEKVMLAEIDSPDNENGCYASNAYFAEFFGLSKRRVSDIINNLVKKGLVNSTIIYDDKTNEVKSRILKLVSTPIVENCADITK